MMEKDTTHCLMQIRTWEFYIAQYYSINYAFAMSWKSM